MSEMRQRFFTNGCVRTRGLSPREHQYGGLDENGGNKTLPMVNLAHELYHAKDYIADGMFNNSIWYISPNGVTTRREYEACLFENKIRAEHGLPFRQYYANFSNNKGYEPSRIPIYTTNPINIWMQRNMSNYYYFRRK